MLSSDIEGGRRLISITYYLACSLGLFIIGLYCLVAKRNMVRLLIGLEMLISAANINFIAFSAYAVPGFMHPLAHVFAILSVAIGGCILAIGLAVTLYVYKHYRTLDVRKLKRIRW
jgi:NADH-quinone oxidoreductase subunit K